MKESEAKNKYCPLKPLHQNTHNLCIGSECMMWVDMGIEYGAQIKEGIERPRKPKPWYMPKWWYEFFFWGLQGYEEYPVYEEIHKGDCGLKVKA